MGPLHWQILLPIALLRPIIFLICADNALDGTITSVDAAANGFASAHYFSEVLLMLSVVPIALVNAAANGFTLIPKYRSQICFRYRWIAVKQNVPLDLLFSVRFHKHTLLHQPIFYLNYAATQYASAGGVCADQCP